MLLRNVADDDFDSRCIFKMSVCALAHHKDVHIPAHKYKAPHTGVRKPSQINSCVKTDLFRDVRAL